MTDPYVEARRSQAAADRRFDQELREAADRGELVTHDWGSPDTCEFGLWHVGPCGPRVRR